MLKSLWNRWIEFTRKRAEKLAWADMMMFGTGFTIRRWWGYQHLNAFSVTIAATTQPPSGEQFFGMAMVPDARLEPDQFMLKKPWFNVDESDEAYKKFVMGKWEPNLKVE